MQTPDMSQMNTECSFLISFFSHIFPTSCMALRHFRRLTKQKQKQKQKKLHGCIAGAVENGCWENTTSTGEAVSGLDLHSNANNTNSSMYSTILYVVRSDSVTHRVLFSHTSVDVATVTSLLLACVGTAPSGNCVTCMQCSLSDTPIRAHTFVCVVSCNLHLLALSGGLDFAATAPEFQFGSLRCRCQHQLSARTEHALAATSLSLRLCLSPFLSQVHRQGGRDYRRPRAAIRLA
jgi:hypothetical protein